MGDESEEFSAVCTTTPHTMTFNSADDVSLMFTCVFRCLTMKSRTSREEHPAASTQWRTRTIPSSNVKCH